MLGNCRYCGQQMMTDEETQEAADYVAEMNCKCKEGMEHRNTENMIGDAKENIDALFVDEYTQPDDAAIILMYKAIDALAAGSVKQVSIKINERTSCKIIRTAKDGIQIKKDYKENFVLEANKF